MQKYTLKNGTRVILTPQKETQAVTVLVLYGVGSRYESEEVAGISHFLEHMMFKGTTRRPNTLALSKELDQVGAQFNAFTGKDHTGYWIKVNGEHLELALDMLSDMLYNSKLETTEIEREKGTIIEEINMYEDTPMRHVETLLEEIVFKGNFLGRDIAGSKKSVKNTTREKMLAYLKNHYTPLNCVISIAGNLNLALTKKMLLKYFGQRANRDEKNKFLPFVSSQKKPQLKLQYKKTEQVHLTFGFLGPQLNDHDLVAAQLLSVILGGSMSSRLFINIRERHGLCYYIRATHDALEDTGLFTIAAGLDKKRINQAITLILKEVQLIKNKGITPAELNKAQEFLKGHLILEMEDSANVSEWYARQELFLNKSKTPEQKIKEVMAVTKNQVDLVAKKIFKNEKINLALIGPYQTTKEFEKLLSL
ncbi:MAG TPA: pitrilysin family protein [bacterium]|nr:pitrilysin family protein [bacterium]HPL95186.1 pitrilysin family protein [bacterium]